MISFRASAISIPCAVLSAVLAYAGNVDLSRYREFQLGMTLPAIASQIETKLSDAKVIHQRPSLIQQLVWRPRPSSGVSAGTDSVEEVVFRFCDGALYQMVVKYDPRKTEGLTTADMIDAISAQYGTASRPDAEIVVPSIYQETVKVLARWEDPGFSLNLVSSSYRSGFEFVLVSKRLTALAQESIAAAARMDRQEAPQREMERGKKLEEETRLKKEKARLANKSGFRP